MPLEAQTRLLRVLQEGEYTPVGGRTPIKTNVRIIAATNRDLRQLIHQGLFREDLFFRLNVVPMRLPPLRERAGRHSGSRRTTSSQQAERARLPRKSIDAAAFDAMKRYRWPGNVRELENLVRRLVALYTDTVITTRDRRQRTARTADLDEPAGGRGRQTLSAVDREVPDQAFCRSERALAPAGPLRSRPARRRTSADFDVPGCHPWQPDQGRRDTRC